MKPILVACALAILATCVLVLRVLPSLAQHGQEDEVLPVSVPKVRTFPLQDCYDDRLVIVFINKDGSARINETPEPLDKLESTLSLIYQNREVRTEVVFVYSDPEVSYGHFLSVYRRVVRGAMGVQMALLTRGGRVGIWKSARKGKVQLAASTGLITSIAPRAFISVILSCIFRQTINPPTHCPADAGRPPRDFGSSDRPINHTPSACKEPSTDPAFIESAGPAAPSQVLPHRAHAATRARSREWPRLQFRYKQQETHRACAVLRAKERLRL